MSDYPASRLSLSTTAAATTGRPVSQTVMSATRSSLYLRSRSSGGDGTGARPLSSSSPLMTNLMCGAVAGILGTLVIYPLDLVKTRLQSGRQFTSQGLSSPTHYTNGWQCAKSIVRQEGFRGLYRGLAANLVGVTPEKALKLAVNDTMRSTLAENQGLSSPSQLSWQYGMLAGATAGFCQVVATTPMEMVKIQFQLASTAPRNAGDPPVTLYRVVEQLGIRGIYKGTFATLCRDVPFSFIFFPLNAALKEAAVSSPNEKPALYKVFLAGIGSGGVAAALVTPMDVVKTRLQAPTRPGDVVYRNMWDCYKQIYRTEGIFAFYKGARQRVLIVAPLFGISLLVYEFQHRLFQ